jgi:tetratricopeptide (TPR) repeat protein
MRIRLLAFALLALAAPARAFETPGLDQAVATYRLDAVTALEASLSPRLSHYQRAEILASKALILSSQKDADAAKHQALAAIDALKASLAANENPIASQFLLFKLYGQLTALDWTFALKTRDPLRYLQTHAPQDRRTRIAEAMNWLFTPPIFGGNPQKAIERLEALHAERFDPETANLLALAYQQTGKREQARAIAEAILERNPRDRSAQDLLERTR